MRVGLDLLYLVPGDTGGTETYARRLIPKLRGVELVAFVAAELADEHPWDIETVRLPVSGGGRAWRSLAQQTLLPVAARRARVDVLHSLANTAPAVGRVPRVVTIHDLIHRRFPETHAGLLGRGLDVLVRLTAARADRIVTLSQSSRDDIVGYLGVDPARIDVVPNGPGADPVAEPTPEVELRARLGLGEGPLVLSVSAKRPHKNLARLIDAVARLEPRPTLVLPGYPTVHEAELRARPGAEGVRFLDWVSDADLEGLYRAATCLAFPSLAEGFGLPVLEAMRRGLPVACSNATSLPEVAGDAALLFDPLSVDAIADAVRRLLGDAELRADLARRGREQAERFSWQASAAGTIAAYERALA